MLRVLIVDDEKIERQGVRFLLSRQVSDAEIYEAENGQKAMILIRQYSIDLLLSDVKMPVMSGLELAQQVRRYSPCTEIVIFSGYNDFSYAREALRSGVSDYVLKPVDPTEFARTIQRVVSKIYEKQEQSRQEVRRLQELRKYFLLTYLHTGNKAALESLQSLDCEDGQSQDEDEDREFGDAKVRCSRNWHKMMLLHVSDSLFETCEDTLLQEIHRAMEMRFFYLNISAGEAVVFFCDRYADYEKRAGRLLAGLKERLRVRSYAALSGDIESLSALPAMMRELEDMMEGEFYETEPTVFTCGYSGKSAASIRDDSRLLEQLKEDMQYRDIPHLRQCFLLLKEKYADNRRYSQMYVKFIFSNLLKIVMEGRATLSENELSAYVDKLYRAKNMDTVRAIVEEQLEYTIRFLQDSSMRFREEITRVKAYILHHYMDDLSVEELAKLVWLSPGYLSSLFKEETGVTLNRFIKEIRMEKARELLESTTMKVTDIAASVGFANSSYFTRSFREYFGYTPEACRRDCTAREAHPVY